LWIQLFKRSLINLRPLAMVAKRHNPKALGLALSGYCSLYVQDPKQEYLERAAYLVRLLESLAITGYSGMCWGYPFDWQARVFFVAEGTPNLVSTCFIAGSLLDYYELSHDENILEWVRSCCDFITKDMLPAQDSGEICFRYIPGSNAEIHNVNMLAAALLSRVARLTTEDELTDLAAKAVRFTVKRQNHEGSWDYGTESYHRWIDNFHTGYVLNSLLTYEQDTKDSTFHEAMIGGYRYYKSRLFASDGTPKYFSNQLLPLDIHNFTQSILTRLAFCKLDKEGMAAAIMLGHRMTEQFQDPKRYFHYQKHRFFTNKIPYMRWSQAWVFCSLARLIKAMHEDHLD
jgi:hypothetical protein